jgi:uncharacterized protein (TIGR02452 family)
MKRSHSAGLGRETLAILGARRYTAPSGQVVSLRESLKTACAGTRTHPPEAVVPLPVPVERTTTFATVRESTLASARRLGCNSRRIAALNFASAKNPGGGFLGGAQAQEESLARASGLFATINGNPMYAFHRARKDPMYTTWVIYSPGVPVFRDDAGRLLEAPYLCSFLTSPAVNAGARRDIEHHREEIRTTMAERVNRVLAVAAHHGHETLILGAWGCGVFRNDPEEVAELFHAALHGPFRGVFVHVVFAVLDRSEERRFIGPFERRFGELPGFPLDPPGLPSL